MSELTFWYREVLSKYADFTGRARRSEYWYFTLFNLLVVIAAIAIGGGTVGFYGDGIGMPIFWAIYGFVILYSLPMLIPSLAVTVRRLHDTGRTTPTPTTEYNHVQSNGIPGTIFTLSISMERQSQESFIGVFFQHDVE